MTSCTFDNNSAVTGGGLYGDAQSTLLVTTSTLATNTPDDINYETQSYDYSGGVTVQCTPGSGCQ